VEWKIIKKENCQSQKIFKNVIFLVSTMSFIKFLQREEIHFHHTHIQLIVSLGTTLRTDVIKFLLQYYLFG